jgi:hypothetical protein
VGTEYCGQTSHTLSEHTAAVVSVAVTADRLISGDADGTVLARYFGTTSSPNH